MLINWLKSQIIFKISKWDDKYDKVLTDFLNDKKKTRLIIQKTENNELLFYTNTVPSLFDIDSIQYFIKTTDTIDITIENINQMIFAGTLKGKNLDSLLYMMNGIYINNFLSNTNWSKVIKDEFVAKLHKFMATLTESAYNLKDQTILYIPYETKLAENNLTSNIILNDKELIQRLESILIHWTRQIKEVVTNLDSTYRSNDSGPLEEINFWKNRSINLSSIAKQLQSKGVMNIFNILKLAESSYLKSFEQLSDMIRLGNKEAKENLTFLLTLKEPCITLSQAKIEDIPNLLYDILNIIRMIWSTSTYYKEIEQLTGLLRKISNEIIRQCIKNINLQQLFDGNIQPVMIALNNTIKCGKIWHKYYEQIVAVIDKDDTIDSNWNFDPNTHGIFAQIDAFIQRCHNLIEIAEGQLQFARKGFPQQHEQEDKKDKSHREDNKKQVNNSVYQLPIPKFGGTSGPEIKKSFEEIEKLFNKHINTLKQLNYNILDVSITNWHTDYTTFKNALNDLDMMMSNVINTAWESITNVLDGINLLEIFQHLAIRSIMKQNIEKKPLNYIIYIINN